MSWRDKVKTTATFRGVSFYVESAELEGGRRTVQHEYPLRDVPFSEDMGRRARAFTVDGHVIGNDYLTARDALLSALEAEGPGELVHPYYGIRRVAVDSFRVRESPSEGGMARFSIDFQETESAPAFPEAVIAEADRIDGSADVAIGAMRARLEAVGEYSTALTSASAAISEASTALEAKLAPLVTETQSLAALRSKLAEIRSGATSLARSPVETLDELLLVFEALTDDVTAATIEALLSAAVFVPTSDRPPATTPTRLAEREAYDLNLWLTRTATTIHAARLAPLAAFETRDQALEIRTVLLDQLDARASESDDETYQALAQLRADLVRAVPGEDSGLPRLVAFTPSHTMPSLVLAHRLYGDVSMEADIIARNGIERPGFVRGGQALEVLSA